MKNIYLISFLVLITQIIQAQTTYEYTYDAAGNRTARYVVELRSMQSPNSNDSSALQENATLGEMQIAVMPNPTAGKLQISISNLPENAEGGIIVWDLQSKEMLRQEGIYVDNPIDLSGQPKGIYLMQIRVGKKKSEWKIVKE